MRLLEVPQVKREVINKFGQQFAGKLLITDAKILCQDKIAEQHAAAETWNVLKYGPWPDIWEHHQRGRKIDKLVFEEDNIILHGVLPVEATRSASFQGVVFTCHVDNIEVIR